MTKDAIATNRKIAEHALEAPYGLKVGMIMADGQKVGALKSLMEAFNLAAAYAAAGSDARMSGLSMPVIINSGTKNPVFIGFETILPIMKYVNKTNPIISKASPVSKLTSVSICSMAKKTYMIMAI